MDNSFKRFATKCAFSVKCQTKVCWWENEEMEKMPASPFKRSLFGLRCSSIGSRRAGWRESGRCIFATRWGFFEAVNIWGRKTFLDQNFAKAGASLHWNHLWWELLACYLIHITLLDNLFLVPFGLIFRSVDCFDLICFFLRMYTLFVYAWWERKL